MLPAGLPAPSFGHVMGHGIEGGECETQPAYYHPDQLYNLADDPFESTNLADSKPDQLRALMKGLIISLNNYHAQYPVAKADNSTPLMPLLP